MRLIETADLQMISVDMAHSGLSFHMPSIKYSLEKKNSETEDYFENL